MRRYRAKQEKAILVISDKVVIISFSLQSWFGGLGTLTTALSINYHFKPPKELITKITQIIILHLQNKLETFSILYYNDIVFSVVVYEKLPA